MVLRCRCGAIGLQVAGDPIAQFFCHCDDCQAVYGGAYAPEAVYPAEDVTVVGGEPKVWTYRRNPRMTCADCGTRLLIDVPTMKLRGINGFLLPPGTFHRPSTCIAGSPFVRSSMGFLISRESRHASGERTISWHGDGEAVGRPGQVGTGVWRMLPKLRPDRPWRRGADQRQ